MLLQRTHSTGSSTTRGCWRKLILLGPRGLRILLGPGLARRKNFTAGNLGPGSLNGLVPHDLAGQRKACAAAVPEDEEDDEEEKSCYRIPGNRRRFC